MIYIHPEIKAKGKPDFTSLEQHLYDVAITAEKIAPYFLLDSKIAFIGGLMHDIGKANTIFQNKLTNKITRYDNPFRHEIVSIFFLSLIDSKFHNEIIEMIIAHHKSIKNDVRELGILDLENRFEDVFTLHLGNWEDWSKAAIDILVSLGIKRRPISIDDAHNSYNYAVNYCKRRRLGWSRWKGLMVAADHFASALADKTEENLNNIFLTPNLIFYEQRKNKLYPLSLIKTNSEKKHTIVTASTGAGKTDFLLRRCKGRVFYVLPFQASINAMYNRIKNDLDKSNPNLDIRLLHGSSSITIENGKIEERMLQNKVGASIKVLTPHQLASVVFGIKGFESILLDIKDSDVILDEIHVYTEITRAIVLKLIDVLKYMNCNIHIGTATMPSVLYKEIISKLGKENVYEVKLSNANLLSFNRHIIYKINSFESSFDEIEKAINENKKVLLVCNRVATSQGWYEVVSNQFPKTKIMLIHSRFKRNDRSELEKKLIKEFSKTEKSCIVISTQVVEVSLDISFDVMITQTAPLDSLIQRFGRINRIRNENTIGKYKPIFVIKPPEKEKETLPYNLEILQRSFEILPDKELLNEIDIQRKIDLVFPELTDKMELDKDAIFKDGKWEIFLLRHKSKSVLLQQLDIDNVSCIIEKDEENYLCANFEKRKSFEIPVRFNSIAYKGLRQADAGSNPFIIPDKAYSEIIGLQMQFVKPEHYKTKFI